MLCSLAEYRSAVFFFPYEVKFELSCSAEKFSKFRSWNHSSTTCLLPLQLTKFKNHSAVVGDFGLTGCERRAWSYFPKYDSITVPMNHIRDVWPFHDPSPSLWSLEVRAFWKHTGRALELTLSFYWVFRFNTWTLLCGYLSHDGGSVWARNYSSFNVKSISLGTHFQIRA